MNEYSGPISISDLVSELGVDAVMGPVNEYAAAHGERLTFADEDYPHALLTADAAQYVRDHIAS